jgi:hypothetical protein
MNQPASPKITTELIRNSITITCDCGGIIFSEKLIFKKISALLSPSGNEEIVPMPVMICDKCGKTSDVFDPNNVIPREIKTTKLINT